MMPLPAPSGASEPATGAKVSLLFDSWAASADAGRASSATSPSRAMSLRMTILHMGLTGNTSMADARSVHFTSSKVMCWVAAHRGARLARLRDDDELAARWQGGAGEIPAARGANRDDEGGGFTPG